MCYLVSFITQYVHFFEKEDLKRIKIAFLWIMGEINDQEANVNTILPYNGLYFTTTFKSLVRKSQYNNLFLPQKIYYCWLLCL